MADALRVVLVDDEDLVRSGLRLLLSHAPDIEVVAEASNGRDAVATVLDAQPDVVLMDIRMPVMDGIAAVEKILSVQTVPIIMLTARSDTPDVVRGLGAGADDYVCKPFRSAELVARLRARLRTPAAQREEAGVITVGDLTIDPAAHVVQLGGEEISLTPLEYSLLLTLAQHPNQVFSRETLLREVWGYTNSADTRLVNVHVQRLRSKVERNADHPQMIITVRGIGYRICTPGEES